MTQPRVAFVVHAYPLLSEAFIAYAALGLVRAGYAVDMVTLHGRREPSEARHPVHDELGERVRVIRPGEPLAGVGAARDAMRTLVARHGVGALKAMDPTRFSRDTFTLRPLMLADALDRAGPYDVVHCQFGTVAAPVIALRRAGLLDAPVVVHFRGYDISAFVEKFGPTAYDPIFEEADWFVANCRLFRDRAVELGCDPGRIDVVPSGCDVARFPFVERRAPPDGAIRLLTVGRLVEKKGQDLAIEAVRLLRAAGCDLRLRVVGDGPLRGDLAAAVAAAGLEDVVEFVGELPHGAIAGELARAHVVLAPSRRGPGGDEDGPVNTLKEAMATGAPVVASRHGGIPELVEDGVSGFLCREGDAADLAVRIAAAIDAAPRWPQIGRAGRRAVEDGYSLDATTAKLRAVYDRVTAPPAMSTWRAQ
jgi:colanic acid/amylovoran biosynthesis glycosyltransferase